MPRSAIESVDGGGVYDDRTDRAARYCVIEGDLYRSDDETIDQSIVSTAQQSSSSHSRSSNSIAFDGGIDPSTSSWPQQDHSEAGPSSSRRRRFCVNGTNNDLLASDDDNIDDCSQHADLGTAISLSRLRVSPQRYPFAQVRPPSNAVSVETLLQTQVLQTVLHYHAAGEPDREKWAAVLDESFILVQPVIRDSRGLPVRAFHPSERVFNNERVVVGIDGMMYDTASLAVML